MISLPPWFQNPFGQGDHKHASPPGAEKGADGGVFSVLQEPEAGVYKKSGASRSASERE